MIVFKMYIASAATSGNECGDSSGSSGPQQGRVPWCPPTPRAWPTHPAAADAQQSESPACDCRLLVIMRQPARLSGNPLEDVVHEGVHYRHRLRRDARVRMHLTQHLVDVDGVALPPPPPPPPPPPLLRLVSLRHLHLRRLLLRSFA
ncbi:hypothetical protein TcWFU_002915 [Taenia crassiceps]|uniref:Uncharacterized protein n=1 Tax=Taenia crassiceps TaxID=6207 RepID=A0ABR4Q043_9CEST